MIRGTLKVDTIKVARITVDFLQNPTKVHALAGLIVEKTGQTLAWAEGSGNIWSDDTRTKLLELIALMEEDLAKYLCGDDVVSTESAAAAGGLKMAGLGEHLGGPDAPSV